MGRRRRGRKGDKIDGIQLARQRAFREQGYHVHYDLNNKTWILAKGSVTIASWPRIATPLEMELAISSFKEHEETLHTIGAMNQRQNAMTADQQGFRIWPVLVTRAMNASTPDGARITYGDLAVAIGYQSRQAGRSLRRALGLIGWLCDDQNLPALNCLVVNQDTMECGESAVRTTGLTTQQERARAVSFNWHPIQPPTAAQLRAADRPWLHIP